MTPEPRYTVAVNMRPVDKPLLDSLLQIAQKKHSKITSVFREALTDFVKREAEQNGKTSQKLDNFLGNTNLSENVYNHLMTPAELKGWSEEELVHTAKLIRGRKEELDAELRCRGHFFRW
jgi:hypothetical protein